MHLVWLGIAVMCGLPLLLLAGLVLLHVVVLYRYLPKVGRIFQEKPLFIIPRGQPLEGAEEVRFRTADGMTLTGCYLKAAGPRQGVILFGLEFGSTCWSCRSYCEHLVAAGYDVFAFEFRNQGSSDSLPGYEPLQWVTEHEVTDTRAAIAYLKSRPDAHPEGVGLFGISKGAGAGSIVAAREPYIRCAVTDGMFATATTLFPYMRQWFKIYHTGLVSPAMIDEWYIRLVGKIALRRIQRARGVRFPSLERALRRLAPRPLLMIHGELDTYIRPEMARALFELAREPKEFWLVEGARHNQALHVAGDEYRRRVLAFFDEHLADGPGVGSPGVFQKESVSEGEGPGKAPVAVPTSLSSADP
jgi:fermentation-respiration switch protein FrsA (DUF1100 family)